MGHIHAAHVCYLVSFTPFGYPHSKHFSNKQHTTTALTGVGLGSARLILLGVNHTSSPLHTHLMTPESIEAFYRTEAFEWARRRGNRKTHIPVLQPYKLRYAELLADFGWEESAREYLLSVRSCIGLTGAGSDNVKGGGSSSLSGHSNTASGNFSMEMLQDGAFIESLKRLDDRICVSTGAERELWENENDCSNNKGGGGAAVAKVWGALSMLKKTPKISKAAEVVMSPSGKECEHDHVEKPHEATLAGLGQNKVAVKEPETEVSVPPQQPTAKMQKKPFTKEGSADLSLISSMANKPKFFHQPPTTTAVVEEISTPKSPDHSLLSNPFSHNNQVNQMATGGRVVIGGGDDTFSMKKESNNFDDQATAGGPMPSSAPPTLGITTNMNEEPASKQSSGNEEKKLDTILSTPSQATKKEDKKKKAPSSEPPSE